MGRHGLHGERVVGVLEMTGHRPQATNGVPVALSLPSPAARCLLPVAPCRAEDTA
jgi:hypothetical protein